MVISGLYGSMASQSLGRKWIKIVNVGTDLLVFLFQERVCRATVDNWLHFRSFALSLLDFGGTIGFKVIIVHKTHSLLFLILQ
jgi:hypothetical protein